MELKDQNSPSVYRGETRGSDRYNPDNGYILIEKGKKYKVWYDRDGKEHREEA